MARAFEELVSDIERRRRAFDLKGGVSVEHNPDWFGNKYYGNVFDLIDQYPKHRYKLESNSLGYPGSLKGQIEEDRNRQEDPTVSKQDKVPVVPGTSVTDPMLGPIQGRPVVISGSVPTSDTPAALPPGFRYVDEPPPGAASSLPPGFKYVDEPQSGPQVNLPAPTAGTANVPSAPEDPATRAMLRTQQSVRPEGGRQEGKFTRAVEGIVPAIGAEGARIGAIMEKGLKTGDLPPGDAMEMAMLASPAPAGRAVVRALTAAERAQAETGVTAIPRAADAGPVGQAIAQRWGGTPEAAARASEQLQAAGEGATARAAGGAPVGAEVAGGFVRKAIEAAGDKASPRLSILSDPNRDVIEMMHSMARTSSPEDIAALAQLRKFVPASEQRAVQGAFVERLGGKEGWNPNEFIANYSRLPDRTKNVLLGQGGEGSLRHHLDSIEAVTRRAPTWQRFEEAPVLGKRALTMGAGAAATAVAGPVVGPLAVLAGLIPVKLIGASLAQPAGAASLAAWSRAYERMMRSSGSPGATAAFSLATRNLNNNLGTDISVDSVLKRGQ